MCKEIINKIIKENTTSIFQGAKLKVQSKEYFHEDFKENVFGIQFYYYHEYNSYDLGLLMEKIKIKLEENGCIVWDSYRETDNYYIYGFIGVKEKYKF